MLRVGIEVELGLVIPIYLMLKALECRVVILQRLIEHDQFGVAILSRRLSRCQRPS